MQMRSAFVSLALVLALPSGAVASESLPCTAIDFSQEFLTNYPNAPAACFEVRQADNGKKYAHFKAEFVGLSGNEVTGRFKSPTGEALSEITFAVDPAAKVLSEGREYKYSELKPGQMLDVWVPESRYGVTAAPGASEMPIVRRTMP